MEQFLQTEKTKKDSGFHNFFLGAVLLHLILFVVLNINKVTKLDVSKEAFLRFTMIKLPPSQEPEPKEEIQPQKTDVKVDAPKQQEEVVISKATLEAEEIKPMGVMQVEERDLLRDKLGSFIPPVRMEESGGGGGGDESGSNVDLPSSFGRSDEGASGSNKSGWGSGAGTGSGSGSGSDEFGKKNVQRFSYGQMAFKQLISGVPDWVEKSSKIIITTVRIWIDPDGKVTKAEISKSSGYLELDQLALDNIKKRSFKPSDNGQTRVALIEIDFTNIR